MKPAIDMLMQEHRLIERVLTALESCVQAIDEGRTVERTTIRDFADFFANFADKCHHAKEEDRLFAKLVERGFPKEGGPVGVMLMEHDQGRTHVGALRRIGQGSGALTTEERHDVVDHALAYVPLLRQHIMKEDRVLYPMAMQAIPDADFDQMMKDFEEYEARVMGAEHQRYHALADTLAATFRG